MLRSTALVGWAPPTIMVSTGFIGGQCPPYTRHARLEDVHGSASAAGIWMYRSGLSYLSRTLHMDVQVSRDTRLHGSRSPSRGKYKSDHSPINYHQAKKKPLTLIASRALNKSLVVSTRYGRQSNFEPS